jgi:hypothetical protein
MMEQAAWDLSVMPISTRTDADGMSIAVVAVTSEILERMIAMEERLPGQRETVADPLRGR